MNNATRFASDAVCRVLPIAASLLLPTSCRSEWLREWRAELYHVRLEAGPQAALDLCKGVLPDALALRAIEHTRQSPRAQIHRSAGICLLVLALILATGCIVALRSPAVMAECHADRYALHSDLVYLKDSRANDWEPSVHVENYRLWASSHQRFFSGFAFYRMERTLWNGSDIPIAHASANLFALLSLPFELGSASESRQPALVLSDHLWRRDFSADPSLVGRMVQFGSRQVRIAAILPDGAWHLPGEPEAWLLEPDAALPAGSVGSVLARMNSDGFEQMWQDRVNIEAYDSDGNTQYLWALSLSDRRRGPWGIYLLAVLLAFLALPALASVSLVEETSFNSGPAAPRRHLHRAFAAAKFVLLLGILFVVPLDVIHRGKPGYLPGADSAQMVLTLALGIFAFWWSVADQRKRCPVCLRRVTHPAHVGIASRTFLTWNGTELFCAGGHTLLEIPDLPTSWFYSPRWVYLDSSWNFLFPV